ncbi:MAG: hypothetical protein ACYTFO_08590, partial [Planctomycetota bacterium]
MHCLDHHRRRGVPALLAGALWLVVSLLPGLAEADVVYLRDGSNVRGEVTEEGDEVIVTQDDGAVTRIPKDQVIYIAVQAVEEDADDEPADDGESPAPPEPEVEHAPPPTPPAQPIVGAITPPATTFAMNKVTLPDSIVYILMRRVASGDAPDLYALHQDIDRWQIAAHDRVRQVHGEWLRPGLFAQRRDRYARELALTTDLARELRTIRGEDDAAEQQRLDINRRINRQLARASNVWLDPPIRAFLQGAAHYRAGAYAEALDAFERARQANPLVAAYHQGVGMCLIEIEGRELDGVAALLSELQLRPDSKQAVRQLSAAVDRVPGELLEEPLFLRAREIVGSYPVDWFAEQGRQPRFVWHMPGARWSSSNNTLPTPPYDRLNVRQAAGVP